MVNHWYLGGEGATACREYRDPLAYDISVSHPSSVSCPACEDWLEDHGLIHADDRLADWERELLEGQPDPVSKPEHYNWHPSGVECKDIAEAFNYYLGNAIKYIWRADHKGKPIEDLQKARNCIDLELQRRAKQ